MRGHRRWFYVSRFRRMSALFVGSRFAYSVRVPPSAMPESLLGLRAKPVSHPPDSKQIGASCFKKVSLVPACNAWNTAVSEVIRVPHFAQSTREALPIPFVFKLARLKSILHLLGNVLTQRFCSSAL